MKIRFGQLIPVEPQEEGQRRRWIVVLIISDDECSHSATVQISVPYFRPYYHKEMKNVWDIEDEARALLKRFLERLVEHLSIDPAA
jgi:hypothetical protein